MGVLALFEVFTAREKRNVVVYALGIMCYKFALEFFNGSFITLGNERFVDKRYQKIGLLTGLNAAMQCLGSIIIAPLIKRYPTRSIMSIATIAFAVMSCIVMVVDASTGGKLKFRTPNNKNSYGDWNPAILFPIYCCSGLAYGMIELIRRVIPRDIVGSDVTKLRRMDASIHVLYEIAGTAGAVSSTFLIRKPLLPERFGYAYSSFLSPVLFTLAAVIWRFVTDVGKQENRASMAPSLSTPPPSTKSIGAASGIWRAFRSFSKAFWYGGLIVLSSRKYIWLVPGYSLALYAHRYLENGLAPIFAKQVIGNSALSQIVGGSNFGELIGALSVLLSTTSVPTPMPWLRIDAIMLNIVWVLPFLPVHRLDTNAAWTLAAIFLPISFGWAAGDVSLAAYIQSTLARLESSDPDVSALGAVMAFLYVTYIVTYAVLSAVLGRWVDSFITAGHSGAEVLKYVGGVQFSVISVIVMAATFVPRGARSFNPKIIDDDMAWSNAEDVEQRSDDMSGMSVVREISFDPGHKSVSRSEGLEMEIKHRDLGDPGDTTSDEAHELEAKGRAF